LTIKEPRERIILVRKENIFHTWSPKFCVSTENHRTQKLKKSLYRPGQALRAAGI